MYKIDNGIWNRIFAVPSEVIDKHIVTASSVSIKVLLLILRHTENSITVEEMSEKLGISKADVCDAANYWVSYGILKKDDGNIAEKVSQIKEKINECVSITKITQSPLRLSGRELEEAIENSKELKFLLERAEKILEKHLIPSEAGILVSLNNWAGLNVDVILMIITYCSSIGKNSLRSIERIALDWLDRGYDTHEKVEKHIQKLTDDSKNENVIKSDFGIYDRTLSAKEKMLISTWFNDYKFEIDMIHLAYEKTIDRTGKMSFPYINTILKSWFENDIHTPKQVSEQEADFEKAKAKENKSKASYNIDNLDEMYDI